MGLFSKKWPKLEEVLAIMPQHSHIKDQVVWRDGIYDFEGWTTLGDTSILIHCSMHLDWNKAETDKWIRKGGRKST